jgi:thermitase
LDLFANPRPVTYQICVLATAMLWAILLLALAPGARGEAAAQPKVDEDPEGAPYVAGELLVLYEPGTSKGAKKAVVRQSGGETAEELPGRARLITFPGIRRDKSEEVRQRALQRKLEDLRDEPGVEAADYNYVRSAFWRPNDRKFDGQWGLRKATFTGAWEDARGRGAKIAVVDSGIEQGHPDIGKISAQKDFVSGDAVANDPYGHGTHVAGVAAALTNNDRGVAGGCPACRLLVARVLDAYGNTTDATLVSGINWSVDNGADVVNLSLGGPKPSAGLEQAIKDASARGAVIVAAAGNTGTTWLQYPAAYPAAIAVSATNKNDALAGFSSRGDWVDLAAPGTGIISARAAGGSHRFYGTCSDAGRGYVACGGTSQSAPFVSALAGLLSSQGKGAGEIRRRMQNTATDLGAAGRDPKYGHGRIDANKAVR